MAAIRTARADRAGGSTSLETVGEWAAARAAGWSPVGEVLGCYVQKLVWMGGGCYGYRDVDLGSRPWSIRPYLDAIDRGYATALNRLTLEARALGGHGVIGVRLHRRHLAENVYEYTALGTAVRAHGLRGPERPFRTTLTGAEVAAAQASGWVPAGIALGISVGVRHDDPTTRKQARFRVGEVTGWTDLVTAVRREARERFRARAAATGGDLAVVTAMTLHVERPEQSCDHLAEAQVLGSTLAAYRTRSPRPTTLTVIPLRTGAERRAP